MLRSMENENVCGFVFPLFSEVDMVYRETILSYVHTTEHDEL